MKRKLQMTKVEERCTFCAAKAEPSTMPPMCPKHLDLAVATDWLKSQGRAINPANVKEIIRSSNGHWNLTPDEVDKLMSAHYTIDYKIA